MNAQFPGTEAAAWIDIMLALIATGAGMPKFWLNAQDDPNRSSAESFGDSAMLELRQMQREFESMVRDIIAFVLDQAVLGGRLPKGTNLKFKIESPDISTNVMVEAAGALSSLVTSMAAAVDSKLLPRGIARRIVFMAANRLGMDITEEEAEKMFDEEEKEREENSPFPGDGAPQDIQPRTNGATNGQQEGPAQGQFVQPQGAPQKLP